MMKYLKTCKNRSSALFELPWFNLQIVLIKQSLESMRLKLWSENLLAISNFVFKLRKKLTYQKNSFYKLHFLFANFNYAFIWTLWVLMMMGMTVSWTCSIIRNASFPQDTRNKAEPCDWSYSQKQSLRIYYKISIAFINFSTGIDYLFPILILTITYLRKKFDQC